ncbi:MAG TPA: hypothetical protein VH475_03545 [Tepidisphaeraceae bacterium]|jgi:hypothetical protein
MIEHDKLFKLLLQNFFVEFIELFFRRSRGTWTGRGWSSSTRNSSRT